MVPPYCVCGCANTTAARTFVDAGSSISASNRPAVPARSSRGITMVLDERAYELREHVRSRHRSQMAGALDGCCLRPANQTRVLRRAVNRDDMIETSFARDDERRRRATRASVARTGAPDHACACGHAPQ